MVLRNVVPPQRRQSVQCCPLPSHTTYRVYKKHLKMVKGCRIDIGLCKKDPPKTHGTRVICETGAGLGGQRARRA